MPIRAAALARRLAAAAGVAAALITGGCHTAPAPRRHDIHITRFAYVPVRVVVHPGDTLRFVNDDMLPHTASSAAGKWDTGNLSAGDSTRLVVPAGGGGEYHCLYHPTMKGSVEITR